MRFIVAIVGCVVMTYATLNNASPEIITFAAGWILAPSLIPPKPPAVQPLMDFRQARNEGLDA